MKEAYFFITSLVVMACCQGNAQDRGNSNNSSPNTKTIKSMLPPQLSYPADESVIEIQNPVLIWIPPRPVSTGMIVTYNLRLVEILKGQSLVEALQQNPALINLSGLSNTFLGYPVDAMPLHAGGYYAWQVAASYGGQNLGVTDIWSFTVKNNNNKKTDDIEYPVASKVRKGHFYVTHGIFYFAYYNAANENELNYAIKSGSTNEALKGSPEIKLRPGMNKIKVDLKQNGSLKNNNYYYLEIKDNKEQIYKITYYYMEV